MENKRKIWGTIIFLMGLIFLQCCQYFNLYALNSGELLLVIAFQTMILGFSVQDTKVGWVTMVGGIGFWVFFLMLGIRL